MANPPDNEAVPSGDGKPPPSPAPLIPVLLVAIALFAVGGQFLLTGRRAGLGVLLLLVGGVLFVPALLYGIKLEQARKKGPR